MPFPCVWPVWFQYHPIPGPCRFELLTPGLDSEDGNSTKNMGPGARGAGGQPPPTPEARQTGAPGLPRQTGNSKWTPRVPLLSWVTWGTFAHCCFFSGNMGTAVPPVTYCAPEVYWPLALCLQPPCISARHDFHSRSTWRLGNVPGELTSDAEPGPSPCGPVVPVLWGRLAEGDRHIAGRALGRPRRLGLSHGTS